MKANGSSDLGLGKPRMLAVISSVKYFPASEEIARVLNSYKKWMSTVFKPLRNV